MRETASNLQLRLLGSTVDIATTHHWCTVLRQLWEPFVVDDPDVLPADLSFEVRSDGGSHRVGFTSEEMLATTDPWVVILRTRVCLAKAAMDRATDLQGLHGAFLGTDVGALILSGSSGAGKSTLAAELASAGFSFGGDDMFGVDLTTNKLVPLPLPPAFKDVRMWPRLSNGWQIPAWLTTPDSAFAVPSSIFGSVALEPATPASVAILERDPDAEPAIEEVTVAEAAFHFSGEGNHVTPTALKRIVTILDNADIFRLRYGTAADALRLLPRRMALADGSR